MSTYNVDLEPASFGVDPAGCRKLGLRYDVDLEPAAIKTKSSHPMPNPLALILLTWEKWGLVRVSQGNGASI